MKGFWRDRKGRSWYVEAFAQHAPKWVGQKSRHSVDGTFDPVRDWDHDASFCWWKGNHQETTPCFYATEGLFAFASAASR